MKRTVIAAALVLSLAHAGAVLAAEPEAQKIELKDGSTLYVHPDGTGRMVDAHGKKMDMHDGEEMQTADGQTLLMKNKKVWVRYGPPGMGGAIKQNE